MTLEEIALTMFSIDQVREGFYRKGHRAKSVSARRGGNIKSQ